MSSWKTSSKKLLSNSGKTSRWSSVSEAPSKGWWTELRSSSDWTVGPTLLRTRLMLMVLKLEEWGRDIPWWGGRSGKGWNAVQEVLCWGRKNRIGNWGVEMVVLWVRKELEIQAKYSSSYYSLFFTFLWKKMGNLQKPVAYIRYFWELPETSLVT